MEFLSSYVLALTLLTGYVYTLVSAHITLARVDCKINVPRRPCGEIKIKDLKQLATTFNACDCEIKRAIFMLTLNNYFIYLLTSLLIFFIITQSVTI